MDTIIFATGNEHKAFEVKKLFEPFGVRIKSLKEFGRMPEVVEDRDSFEGNARKKAEEIYKVLQLPVIADDSGLCVDELEGLPGVRSARFAGSNSDDAANNRKLVEMLREFEQPCHGAFICSAVFYDGNEFTVSTGKVRGTIISDPRGNQGFGYDPHFIPEGYDKTMAELGLRIKNTISHRARAFHGLINKLKERFL